MHDQVLSWVSLFRTGEDLSVLDIGGRDLNGTTRALFPNAAPYHVLDLRPGPNVDFVADASKSEAVSSWINNAWPNGYDLVLCTETFEHTPDWAKIIETAWRVLRPGGWLIFTCAGPGRSPHSGISAKWELDPGEHYANVSASQIAKVLAKGGWGEIETHQVGSDTQGKAVKPIPSEVLLGAALDRAAS